MASEKWLGTRISDAQRVDLRSALSVPSVYKVESGPEDLCCSCPPLIQHTGTTVIAHEFAHASSPIDRSLNAKQKALLRQAWAWGSWLFPYFCAMHTVSRRYAQGTGRALPMLEIPLKVLMVVSAAAQLPKLAEEAQASVRGCAAIGKVMGMRETLKSAALFSVCFGSYLLPLAEGAAMPVIFEKEAAAKSAICGGLKKVFRRKP